MICRFLVFFLTPALLAAAEGYAQRKIGFDHANGPYELAEMMADFGLINSLSRRDFAQIKNGLLGVTFKAGKKVVDTGLGLQAQVPDAEACEISFRIRYPEGFQVGLHGKQMGLSGGKGYDGGRGEEARAEGDGWSVRLQFDALEDAVRNSLYVYHVGMAGKFGESLRAGSFTLQRGRWYALRLRATAQSTAEASDGRIEVWCDGEKKIDAHGLHLVAKEEGRTINRVRAELFPGGGGAYPKKDTVIAVDDFAWITLPARPRTPPPSASPPPAGPAPRP